MATPPCMQYCIVFANIQGKAIRGNYYFLGHIPICPKIEEIAQRMNHYFMFP